MQDNEFVYRFKEVSSATLSCAGMPQQEIKLRKTGIIKIGNSCTLANKDFIIKRRNTEGPMTNYTVEHADWAPEYDPEYMEARVIKLEADMAQHNSTSGEINGIIQEVQATVKALNETTITSIGEGEDNVEEAHLRIDLWSLISMVHGATSGGLGLLVVMLGGLAIYKLWTRSKKTETEVKERNLAIKVEVDKLATSEQRLRHVNGEAEAELDNV